MSESQASSKSSELLDEVLSYVDSSAGLRSKIDSIGNVEIIQSVDGKIFNFSSNQLDEVLQRIDNDGKSFIQVNFTSGIKVLFTDSLVGFKPRETLGLDMTKIPKVVTTPDLISVFEAIEESLSSDYSTEQDVDILKRVFHSILIGGELAGFDLSYEKKWLTRLVPSNFKVSA